MAYSLINDQKKFKGRRSYNSFFFQRGQNKGSVYDNMMQYTIVAAVKALPIWTLSGPMSNTLTRRAMKLRIVLKFIRPMLQEPSSSSTMSAFAVVLH